MSGLGAALDTLLDKHRAAGSPIGTYLRPGLSRSSVREQIAAVGLDPPDELTELFAWHDGFDSDSWHKDEAGVGFPRLFGDTYFAPLTEALTQYHEAIALGRDARVGGDLAESSAWRQTWFPAFSRGWETYAVECSSDPLIRGCVFEVYWHPGPTDEPVVPAFRNLTAMIRAVVRRFERGGYWWDPDDRFLQERPDVLDELIAVERREARGDWRGW